MRKLGWLSSLCIKLALILLPVVSFSQSWGPKNVNIGNSGGYYEYLPVGYNDPANANRKYPVILALHGVGELGNGTSDLNMITGLGIPGYIQQGNFPSSVTVNGVSHSFIVIAPQFRVWPSYQDVEQYLNYIESKYRADASRLYLTGLSMGGGVAWDYAGSSLAAAQRIAALLPVCGASSPNDPAEKYMSSANLPVLATHNDGDGIVALSNTIGYVDGINNYGPNPRAVKVIFSSGAHNAWTRTYDPNQTLYGGMNAYQWLLQYTRGSSPVAPSPVSVNITSTTHVSCASANNGSATAAASGGAGPYTYSWNTSPVQTSTTASNLAAGNYTVTAKDANGNTATASVTINQPAPLSFSVVPGTIAAYGGSTSVALSATGGTAPYTYTGPTSNVVAGTYTYKVTDAKGCGDTKTITISQPAAVSGPSANISSKTDVTCNGATNGSATVSASGGTAPYTYSWNSSPVQTGATASNLAAGNYSVTVKDANGNSTTASATIAQPAALVISVAPGAITEYQGKTLVTLSAQGGTAPYTFSGGPTASVTAGTYTYKVTDAKGCTDSKTVTITEPAAPAAPVAPTTPLSVSATGTDLTCNGANNGSAAAVASGGDGSFSYSWNTSPVQTTATASNLAAGTYTVTVKDGKGTTATKTVTIAQPAPLVISVAPGAITEYQGKTLVTLSAQGGTAPYTFSGGPTASVTAGTYTYKVTDAKGCTDSKTVTITEPAAPAAPVAPTTPLSVSATGTDLTCNGANNGSAAAVASGGDGSFSYSWNTSPVQTTATASNLAAGTYTVTVKDGKGTTATKTVTIAQPAPLVISVTPGTITENNGKTLVTLSAQGGTAPYTYSGGPTTAVKAGTYTYTVTDAKGCTDSKTVTITDAASATAPVAPTTPLSVSVTSTDIACNGAGDGSATAVVSGGVGSFSYSWNTNPVQTGATASNLAAGNYTVTVKDGNGTTATKTVTITEPAKLSLLVSPGVITEYQGKTLVALNAQGGTAPYTYSGGPTTAVRAGTYTYTVTDANGCTDSKTITLTEPSATAGPAVPLSVSVTSTNIACNGANNGSATAVASGGVGSITYSWNTSPVQNNATASGLRAGTYTVTVKDANGTIVIKTVTVTEPAKLTILVSPGVITEYQGKTLVSLNAQGGTAPYTYSGGPTYAVRAGTYTYTVTDAKGCTDSKTITLTEPGATAGPAAPLSVTATSTNITCNGANNGTASAVTSGGAGSVTYNWNTIPVQSSASISGLRAGTYTVTVKDANGATATKTVTIAEPTKLTILVSPGVITEYQGKTLVSVNAQGGTAPYTYSGGPTYAVRAGTYTYTVTDAKGCTASKTITLTEPGATVSNSRSADPGVTLSAYSIQMVDTSAAIQWSTSYENAIDHFEIERTTDNSNYNLVGRVTSLWGSQKSGKYTIYDAKPLSKKNSYRISAIATNGKKIVLQQKDAYYVDKSKISIKNMTNSLDITVENPFMEELTVMIHDLNGKPLGMKTFQKQSFTWNTKWDMQSLRPGTYVLSISGQNVKYAKQVMKL
jgi:predicted esterase